MNRFKIIACTIVLICVLTQQTFGWFGNLMDNINQPAVAGAAMGTVAGIYFYRKVMNAQIIISAERVFDRTDHWLDAQSKAHAKKIFEKYRRQPAFQVVQMHTHANAGHPNLRKICTCENMKGTLGFSWLDKVDQNPNNKIQQYNGILGKINEHGKFIPSHISSGLNLNFSKKMCVLGGCTLTLGAVGGLSGYLISRAASWFTKN